MICAVEGYNVTRWLTGLWSKQIKGQGKVPKSAWHSGSNISIVNNPNGKPDRPRGAPWTVNICLPPVSWKSSLTWGSKR